MTRSETNSFVGSSEGNALLEEANSLLVFLQQEAQTPEQKTTTNADRNMLRLKAFLIVSTKCIGISQFAHAQVGCERRQHIARD